MQIVKLVAPSAWATYLINGDATGIEPGDKQAADQWILSLGFGAPLSCDDYGFCTSHDAFNVMPFGADCQEYAFDATIGVSA